MDFEKLLQDARQTDLLAKQGKQLPVQPINTIKFFNLVQTHAEAILWDTRSPEEFARSHFRGSHNGRTAEWAKQQLSKLGCPPFQKATIVLIGQPPDEMTNAIRVQYDAAQRIFQILSDELERAYPFMFLTQEQEDLGMKDQATRRAYCSYPAIFSDNLLCGTIVHGSQFQQLKLLGVKACMDLSPNGVPNLADIEGMTVLRPDTEADIFDCAAMLDPNTRTLVFDVASEKAPSVICAFYMHKHEDWTATTALAFVMNKVPSFKPSVKSHQEIQRGPPEKLEASDANSCMISMTDIRDKILDAAEKWRIIPPDTEEGKLASRALSSEADALEACRLQVIKRVKENQISERFTSLRCLLGALVLRDDESLSVEYKDAISVLWDQVKDEGTSDLENVLAGRFPMSTDGLPQHMSDLLRPLVLRLGIIDL
eukprot:GEMP01032071.1.p1 GENE.GEMP01032071.1~~GEMP01032071.1.p1  ORF type:complete len:427 (+),score=70.93 GEMP01032071.1:95-1375(+)